MTSLENWDAVVKERDCERKSVYGFWGCGEEIE